MDSRRRLQYNAICNLHLHLAIPSGRLFFNYGRFLFVANRAVLRNDRAGSDRTDTVVWKRLATTFPFRSLSKIQRCKCQYYRQGISRNPNTPTQKELTFGFLYPHIDKNQFSLIGQIWWRKTPQLAKQRFLTRAEEAVAASYNYHHTLSLHAMP